MTLTYFLITLLVAYTIMFAFQEGKIPFFLDKALDKLRDKVDFFERLFSCSYCLGFWSGLISYAAVHLATQGLVASWQTLALAPLIGLSSSAFCYIATQVTLIADVEDEMPPELEAMLMERQLMQEGLPGGHWATENSPSFSEDCNSECPDCRACDEDDDDEDLDDDEYPIKIYRRH